MAQTVEALRGPLLLDLEREAADPRFFDARSMVYDRRIKARCCCCCCAVHVPPLGVTMSPGGAQVCESEGVCPVGTVANKYKAKGDEARDRCESCKALVDEFEAVALRQVARAALLVLCAVCDVLCCGCVCSVCVCVCVFVCVCVLCAVLCRCGCRLGVCMCA